MNGKEKDILSIVANDVKWMKDKQKNHDKTLGKIWKKLDQGSDKIAENRTRSKTSMKLIYFILTCLGGLLILMLRLHNIG